MIMLGKHSLLQGNPTHSSSVSSSCLLARRPKPLCATWRCTSLVVPRSTAATKRPVTLTTCSSQPAPLPCLPCICCLIQTGQPQPSCFSGPSVLWVSLPGAAGVSSDALVGWHRDKAPTLICCIAAEPLTRATKHLRPGDRLPKMLLTFWKVKTD